MKYEFLVQDELDRIDGGAGTDGRKLKDPVILTLTIEMEKTKYKSTLAKYKEHPVIKFLKFFK